MIYICHTPSDRAVAEKVYMGLKQKGLKCWIPSNDILDDQSYAEAIIDAIEKSTVMVFIYSSNSNTSPQTIHELEKAGAQNKFIIPFKIESTKPSKLIEYYLSSPYKLDATNGTLEDNIDRLGNIVRKIYQQLPGYNNNDVSTIKDTSKDPFPEKNNANIIKDVPNNYNRETIPLKELIQEVNSQLQGNQNFPPHNQINPDTSNMGQNAAINNTGYYQNNQTQQPVFSNEGIRPVNPQFQGNQNFPPHNQINPNTINIGQNAAINNAGYYQNNQTQQPVFSNEGIRPVNPQFQNNLNIPSVNQDKPTKKSKTKILVGASILGGIIMLSIVFILTKSLFFSPKNPLADPINNKISVFGGKDSGIEESKFTDEEIIDFTKTAILKLSSSKSLSEFYDIYGYKGAEYDIKPIHKDVSSVVTSLDIIDFEEVSIIAKNKKEYGIVYLLQVNFTCCADHESQSEESLLYSNTEILETPDGGLKYLYMEGIFEDELKKRNKNIESSYQKIAGIDDLDTVDTIENYLPDPLNENAMMSVKDIVAENDHKVVSVHVESDEGGGQGSGFFIKDGVIATNYHVIEGAKRARIRLLDGTEIGVEGVLFSDPHVDFAVLKLVKEIGIEPVTIAEVRESDKGSMAVAIGSPLGHFNTVSTGILSNFWVVDGVSFIQISIPITFGNSGGALFDSSGNLIGITTGGLGEANLNFAIPSSYIIPIYDEIKHLSFNQLKAVPLSNTGYAPVFPDNQIDSSNQQLLSSKYEFANSNRPISYESVYTSNIQTIYDLISSKYYDENSLHNDIYFALRSIMDFGSENYGWDFEYILHDTCIEEEIEAYIEMNSYFLEVINSMEEPIFFSVEDIEIIGAGIKKDGTIDGIIVSAVFSQNYEPCINSKFYFKPEYSYSQDYISGFLYVGVVTEKE